MNFKMKFDTTLALTALYLPSHGYLTLENPCDLVLATDNSDSDWRHIIQGYGHILQSGPLVARLAFDEAGCDLSGGIVT